ncbi:hypothetical protein HYC85_019910, partial [Camellia sinensis]
NDTHNSLNHLNNLITLIPQTPLSLSTSSFSLFLSLLSLNLCHRCPIFFKFSTTKISAIISVGDKLHESTISYFDAGLEIEDEVMILKDGNGDFMKVIRDDNLNPDRRGPGQPCPAPPR